MDSWDVLKREARGLEALLDAKIQAYGRGDARGSSDVEAGLGGGPDPEAAQAREIEDALEKLASVTEQMSKLLADRPSRANAATVQRYREVTHDFKATARRTSAALRQRRENAALFRSLRGGGPGAGGGADESATDALLRERGSLASSSKALDAVLAQAAETRDALARQRAGILSAGGTLGALASALPGVGALMGAIDRRRSRNDRVVALTAAACACFIVWWFALRKTA